MQQFISQLTAHFCFDVEDENRTKKNNRKAVTRL